ncbi:30S ribosomal protein S2 [Lactiplantibacillus plantarum]|nr:30S ribosomal protein S2 [Lactiplantibacillus plantarum]
MFEVIESKINTFGRLIYLESSHEFVSEPSVNSDITILVGYIYIGFDSENSESTQVWGFHHNFNWKSSILIPPKAHQGKVVLDEDINPGDSKRITDANSWKTDYDISNGWLRFGEKITLLKVVMWNFFQAL